MKSTFKQKKAAKNIDIPSIHNSANTSNFLSNPTLYICGKNKMAGGEGFEPPRCTFVDHRPGNNRVRLPIPPPPNKKPVFCLEPG